MKQSRKSLLSSIAAATLVGSIGLVYAQAQSTDAATPSSTTTNTQPTMDRSANPGTTSAVGTTPSTASTDTSTVTTPNATTPMDTTQGTPSTTDSNPGSPSSMDTTPSTGSNTLRDDVPLPARADRN